MVSTSLTLHHIGVIRTPHASKYAAPRQPATSRSKSIGVITLYAGSNFEQALEDLDGFDYIWVLFWFHENTNWKPKILPPASDRKKRGVFATRSPHRPNPIGLSLCRLLDVKGRTIRIENPDMLDGTPILDIKPYLPHAESQPNARSGWIGGSDERTDRPFRVVIRRSAHESLLRTPTADRKDMIEYLKVTLSRDPYLHAYRRIKAQPDGSWVIAVKRWRFIYMIKGDRVEVTDAFPTIQSNA